MTRQKLLGMAVGLVSVLLLPHAASANIPTSVGMINTKAIEGKQSWVVSPGTRLVAGANRGELYILGGGQAPAPVVKVASAPTTKKVRAIIMTKQPKLAHRKIVSKVKVALQRGGRHQGHARIKG